jgi:hypothetical protein
MITLRFRSVCRMLIIFNLMQLWVSRSYGAPAITREQFNTSFPYTVAGRVFHDSDVLEGFEKGGIYKVMANVVQVGDGFVIVDDGKVERPNSFGVIKLTPEFLENFAGMKGDGVSFLAEFTGYGNFPTVSGGSLRLAIFNAAYYQPLYGGDIKVVNNALAENVAAIIANKKPSTNKESGIKAEQMNLTSSEDQKLKILGEWIHEVKNPSTGVVAVRVKDIFKKDGIYEMHLTETSENKTIVSNGKWSVTDGNLWVEYRLGNLETNNIVKAKIVLKDEETFAKVADSGSELEYKLQKAEKSGADVSVNGDKPMKTDDTLKIKVAELKGELAGIDQKIEAERKRWLNASDVINRLTNNRTRPVIRNSPEHEMLYEAQLIMKEVEGKAPELKEQKAKIEATLKALE